MQTDTTESKAGDLLARVAKGSEKAMEHCIAKYGGLIWSIVNRYVKNRSSAEDVVQETFTDLWKSSHRFNPSIATESTFIGVLARRRALDHIRKESRRPTFEQIPDSEGSQQSVDPNTSLRCASQDVREALKQLPTETQAIFKLHFELGKTHPEIVEATGLPLGTVKTRLRRGLIEIRNVIQRLEKAQPSNPTAR